MPNLLVARIEFSYSEVVFLVFLSQWDFGAIGERALELSVANKIFRKQKIWKKTPLPIFKTDHQPKNIDHFRFKITLVLFAFIVVI